MWQDRTLPVRIVYAVDPEEAIGEALTVLLNSYRIDVCCYPDARSFLDACATLEQVRSCLMVEASLPDMSGLSLLQRLQALGYQFPAILLTDRADRELRQRALRLGAAYVVEKPLVNTFLIGRLFELLD